jgi:hypothetical protein
MRLLFAHTAKSAAAVLVAVALSTPPAFARPPESERTAAAVMPRDPLQSTRALARQRRGDIMIFEHGAHADDIVIED